MLESWLRHINASLGCTAANALEPRPRGTASRVEIPACAEPPIFVPNFAPDRSEKITVVVAENDASRRIVKTLPMRRMSEHRTRSKATCLQVWRSPEIS
jgi:hypothetical protein